MGWRAQHQKLVSLKDSAAPVAKTGATAAKQTETNAGVNETTNNKLLNLSPENHLNLKNQI